MCLSHVTAHLTWYKTQKSQIYHYYRNISLTKDETKKEQNERVKSEECWGLGMSKCPWERLCQSVAVWPGHAQPCRGHVNTTPSHSSVFLTCLLAHSHPLFPHGHPQNEWIFHSDQIRKQQWFAVCLSSSESCTSAWIYTPTSHVENSHFIATV